MIPAAVPTTKAMATFENRISPLASITKKHVIPKKNGKLPLAPAAKEPETLTLSSSDDEKEDISDNHRGTSNSINPCIGSGVVRVCCIYEYNLCDKSLILLLSLFFCYYVFIIYTGIYGISKFS